MPTTVSTTDPAVLTQREVAALIRVSDRTLTRWLAAGTCPIPPLAMPGRYLRWSRVAVERFLGGTP